MPHRPLLSRSFALLAALALAGCPSPPAERGDLGPAPSGSAGAGGQGGSSIATGAAGASGTVQAGAQQGGSAGTQGQPTAGAGQAGAGQAGESQGGAGQGGDAGAVGGMAGGMAGGGGEAQGGQAGSVQGGAQQGGAGGALAGCDALGEAPSIGASIVAGDGADQEVTAVAAEGDDAFVTGVFSGQITLGSTTLDSQGPRSTFIARIDPSGTPLWAVRLGGADATVEATSIAVSAGNVHVVGRYTGTPAFDQAPSKLSVTTAPADRMGLFAARLDASGAPAYLVTGTQQPDQLTTSIFTVATASASFIAPIFRGTVKLGGFQISAGGEGLDGFYARLNASGDLITHNPVQEPGDDTDFRLSLDAGGNPMLFGNCGPYVYFGAQRSCGGLYLLRISKTGAPELFFDAVADVTPLALSAGAVGEAYAAFISRGSLDLGLEPIETAASGEAIITRISLSDGAALAQLALSGKGDHLIDALASAQDGVVVAGNTTSDISFGNASLTCASSFVTSLDGKLAHRWSLPLLSASPARVTGLASTAAGIWAVGWLEGPTSIAGTSLPHQGGRDAFIIKLTP